MSKATLHLLQGYFLKTTQRLRSARPGEILPLIRTGVRRAVNDLRSDQLKQIIPLLQDYVVRTCPELEAPKILNFYRNNTGWENETYTFSLTWGPARRRSTEDLILCIYPGASAQRRANTEYQTLSKLRQAGYPVPAVKNHEPGGDRLSLGRPFLIMERIDGRRLWKPLTQAGGQERERLLSDFCGLLARLHALDWRILADDPAHPLAADSGPLVAQFLADQQTEVQSIMLPGFEAGWEWILSQGKNIASSGPAIAHFDFHPDNVILCDHAGSDRGGLVVIDWTNAAITDYRFDLAWTLLLVELYSEGDWRTPILREYECQSGRKVEDFEFFEVVSRYARLLRIFTVVTRGAEDAGFRAGTEETMLSQVSAVQRVYDRYRHLTGITIPEVEQFLVTVRL